ncbi:restriction endonuclease subunit S [Peribacillus sp. NPDC096379]|uniref:restriction endonuclease subunit S n=1 Tax=Peribacillus sp. NPDC096379 TaxID=3364393 RepID=UPI00382C3302
MGNKQTPDIRFGGFTGDWEQRKVQWLIDEGIIEKPMDGNHGEKHPTASEYVDYGIPFLMASDIKHGIVDFRNCNFITIERSEKLDKGFAKNGDVLITHKATVGEVAILSGLSSEYAVLTPQVTYYRVIDKSKLAIKYLYAYFNSQEFQNTLKLEATQSTRPYIGITGQHKLEIKFPKAIKEQEKIGECFSDLDNLITLHQQELTTLKQTKQGFLQKMFPKEGESVPEVRFPGFTHAWEQRRVSDFAEETYGGGTPKTSVDEYWSGNLPWIQSSDLNEHQVSDTLAKKKITETGLKNSASKLVPANSIAVVTRVGVGKLAFMPFEYATSQDFLSLSKLKVDEWFGVYSLYKKLQSELHAVQGTSIKGITKEELLSKDIKVPVDIDEQFKIGEFFNQLDNHITLHQRELEVLQETKKAFLKKMFV